MKPTITESEFEKIEMQIVLEYARSAPSVILHQMAMQWNGSKEFLQWLVNRQETDKATAFMIYWMSGPSWWKQFGSKQELLESSRSSAGFDFTEELEAKLLSGLFKILYFAFDPTSDDAGTIWANEYLDVKTVRDIPGELFRPLIGEAVEHPDNFEEGKPPELVKIISEAYEGYEIID